MDLKTGMTAKVCDIELGIDYASSQVSKGGRYIGLQRGRKYDRFSLDVVDVKAGTLKTVESDVLYIPGRQCSNGQCDQFDFLDDDSIIYQRAVHPKESQESGESPSRHGYYELVVYDMKSGRSKVVYQTK